MIHTLLLTTIPNITIPDNASSFQGLGQFANSVTFGVFGPIIIFVSFAILLIGLSFKLDISKGLLASSFFEIIFIIVLAALHWTSGVWVVPFLATAAIGFAMVVMANSTDPYG